MGLIYKITNEVTGQIYVGKTTRTLVERWAGHVAKHRRSAQYLHRSMKVYGLISFNITTIEECDDAIIDDREKYWIKELDSMAPKNFNMKDGGEGGDTSKSENYIVGMKNRKSMSGSNNPMYGIGGMKGKTHSSDTIEKQKDSHRALWENMTSEERKTRGHKVVGQKNGMFGKLPSNAVKIEFNDVVYNSLKEAHEATGHSQKFITKNGKIL